MAIQSEAGQIQEFLAIFKKRRWQVILPALFVLGLGSVFAVIVPKKFVVETQVELLEPSAQFGDPEEAATLREISNAEFHIKNARRVREVIESEVWPEYVRLNDDDRFELISSVSSNISVNVRDKKRKEGGSVFVDIKYSDVDGRRGEKFLTALTKRWIDDVIQRDHNQMKAEREEYQNQASEAQQHYVDVLQQFTDLVREMGISITQPTDLKSQREEDPLFTELTIARQNRDVVEADLEELRAKIEALRDDHEQMERQIPKAEVDEGVDAGSQILGLEGQITKLRATQEGKTTEHSAWKRAEAQIEGLREQIRTIEGLQRESTTRTVWIDNPERGTLAKRIAELEVEASGLVAKMDKWTREIDDKYTKHQAQVANWNDLLRVVKSWEHASDDLDEAEARLRRINVKLGAYTAAQGDPYRIAEPPRAPTEPSEPNPWGIVAVSLLAGLAFGLAVAFIAEFSKNCFRSVGDVTRAMGVPVLGVINTIRTSADRRRHRLKRALIGGSTAVILGGLAWFTYAWALHPEQLPTSVIQVVDDFRLSLR